VVPKIAARASLLNEKIKPDLTICLHFNAVEWDDCQSSSMTTGSSFFVHGNYLASELKDDEQKLRLFSKLLEAFPQGRIDRGGSDRDRHGHSRQTAAGRIRPSQRLRPHRRQSILFAATSPPTASSTAPSCTWSRTT